MANEPNTRKLSSRERRYKAALNAIERCKQRREAAIRMLTKCEALLPKLERRARRLGAPPRQPTIKLDAPPPVALPTIEPAVAADGIPDFLRRGQEAQQAVDATIAQAAERDQRMKALGFRKSGRRKRPQAAS